MLNISNHGAVREIRLDRPPVNALDPELVGELDRALRAAGEEAQAVVLSGRPGMFSAGLDVPALMQLDREGMCKFWTSFFGLMRTLAASKVPVAAAITGHSPAGGAVISLFCDTRVMTRGDYRIGLNEVAVGLVVPPVIQAGLRRLVGAHRAERLMVAGALISPDDALEVGLVDQLADDPEGAVEAAIGWCKRHCELPRQAMIETRKLARADLAALFEDMSSLGIEAFVNAWFADHTQATLKALVERLKKK